MVSRSATQRSFEFGSFRVDAVERSLLQDDQPIQLQPKTFDLLLMLVENCGHVLEKDELLAAIWPDAVVEESNLSQNVYLLRKILSSDPDGLRYIETVPKRGYRFVAPLKGSLDAPSTTSVRATLAPELSRTGNESKVWPLGRVLTAVLIAILAGLAAGSVVVYRFVTRQRASALEVGGAQSRVDTLQRMKIRRVTDIGKVRSPAISPDGKYLAYTLLDSGQYSLWVQQMETGSATQIRPPDDAIVTGVEFSHDGQYVLYERVERGSSTVYQLPFFGGVPRKIASNVWSGVALSPDDQRIAFIRPDLAKSQTVLVAAGIDGGEEKSISVRKPPEYFEMWNLAPAWSPDGTSLVCVAGSPEGQVLIEASITSEGEKRLGNSIWNAIESVAWLPDSSGLIITASEGTEWSCQVWHVSYPAGEVRRVINDLNRYNRISLTQDGRMLLAERWEGYSHLWVLPDGDQRRAKQLTFGNSNKDGDRGLCWASDGKVIYSAEKDGRIDLWRIDSDGRNQLQLTANAGGWNARPSVSPDGSHIAFVSDRAGYRNIWVMDIDGRNTKQLTFGKGEMDPGYIRGGEWIYYSDWASNGTPLKKVSLAGGDSIDVGMGGGTLSPDGNLVAKYLYNGQSDRPWQTQVVPFGGSEPIRTFYEFYRGLCRWTPDAKNLTYIDQGDFYNVWQQPMDGSPPRRLTRFKSGTSQWLAWSPDGKNLALARGEGRSDVVLLTDFR